MLTALDYRAGDWAGALKHFSHADSALATQSNAPTEYGACLVKLKRFREAVPVFERMRALEPESDTALYNLALAQSQNGQQAEALQTIAPLVQKRLAAGYALTLAADIREARGDTQQSFDLLRRAILTYPKEKDAYLDFANLSYNHG